MNNVIPIRPAEPVPIVIDAVRHDTASELITAGVTPQRGDYVRTVRYSDDEEGGVVLSTPGSGRVRAAIVDDAHQTIRLTFDFGLTVAVHGATVLTWYQDPERVA